MNHESITYRGSCHCGAVTFSFRSSAIVRGKRCNCSICRRKGALMSVDYYPKDAILSLQGLESLTVYHFGDRMVNHYFCKTCGIYPFHDAIENPGVYRFNLGCVDGIDVLALDHDVIDGAAF